jgi:hypothetical protein
MWTIVRDAGKGLWRGLLAPPRAAVLVAVAALIILVVKIGYLNAIPEWFDHADEYGQVVQDILEATVAAYVFFLISIQLPAVREKRLVGPSVAMLADQIAQVALRFLLQVNDELNAQNGVSALPQPVTLKVVADLFSRIPPNGEPRVPIYDVKAPGVVRLSWMGILTAQNTQCLDYIDQLWRYSRFIEPELATHLDALRFSLMSRFLQPFRGQSADTVYRVFNNPDLSVLAKPYFQYHEEALGLQAYCEQFRRAYGIGGMYQGT